MNNCWEKVKAWSRWVMTLCALLFWAGCAAPPPEKMQVSFRRAQDLAVAFIRERQLNPIDYELMSRRITSLAHQPDARYEWWTFKVVPNDGVKIPAFTMIYVNCFSGNVKTALKGR